MVTKMIKTILTYYVHVLFSDHSLIEAEWRIYASAIYPSLIQIMACDLVGAKSLFELMLEYC